MPPFLLYFPSSFPTQNMPVPSQSPPLLCPVSFHALSTGSTCSSFLRLPCPHRISPLRNSPVGAAVVPLIYARQYPYRSLPRLPHCASLKTVLLRALAMLRSPLSYFWSVLSGTPAASASCSCVRPLLLRQDWSLLPAGKSLLSAILHAI